MSLHEEVYDEVKERKRNGESFNDVISRLLKENQRTRPK